MFYKHKMIRLRTIFRSNYHIMVTWIKRIGLKLQSSMKLKWISNWTYLLVQKVSFSFSKFLCIWLYRISNVKKDFSYVNLNYLMFYDIICHHTPSKYRFIHTLKRYLRLRVLIQTLQQEWCKLILFLVGITFCLISPPITL